MTLEGEMRVEGPWVDGVNGLESVQVDIVMMRTPDGHGRLELTKFRNPRLVEIEPAIAPPNTLGLRSVMFTVESVDETVASPTRQRRDSSGRWPSTRTITALLHARPCGHHRRAGRRTLLKPFTAFGETGAHCAVANKSIRAERAVSAAEEPKASSGSGSVPESTANSNRLCHHGLKTYR